MSINISDLQGSVTFSRGDFTGGINEAPPQVDRQPNMASFRLFALSKREEPFVFRCAGRSKTVDQAHGSSGSRSVSELEKAVKIKYEALGLPVLSGNLSSFKAKIESIGKSYSDYLAELLEIPKIKLQFKPKLQGRYNLVNTVNQRYGLPLLVVIDMEQIDQYSEPIKKVGKKAVVIPGARYTVQPVEGLTSQEVESYTSRHCR